MPCIDSWREDCKPPAPPAPPEVACAGKLPSPSISLRRGGGKASKGLSPDLRSPLTQTALQLLLSVAPKERPTALEVLLCLLSMLFLVLLVLGAV